MKRRPRFTIARMMRIIAACGVVLAVVRSEPIAVLTMVYGVPIAGVLLACRAFPPKQPVSSVAWDVVIGGCLGGVAGALLGHLGFYAAMAILDHGFWRTHFPESWESFYGVCCFGSYLGAPTGSVVRLWQSLGRGGRPIDVDP